MSPLNKWLPSSALRGWTGPTRHLLVMTLMAHDRWDRSTMLTRHNVKHNMSHQVNIIYPGNIIYTLSIYRLFFLCNHIVFYAISAVSECRASVYITAYLNTIPFTFLHSYYSCTSHQNHISCLYSHSLLYFHNNE